ncbi:hypothetical protein J6590_016051 [Homalodisca vitripennis]|nr:hypothetical protein J6590_016051 [Homalodisca vitripennis]
MWNGTSIAGAGAGAGAGEQLVGKLVKVNQLTSTNQSNQAENQYSDGVGKIRDKNKLSKLSPGLTSPTKKGATPNKTSPPLKEEPTSSGTGNGKSRTLTGNEVLSRRQTRHDPPEILRGASLGERRKEKESKTTPQGKPGVISPRTPPQPHQYPEHDQRCHHGRPSDEKRGPSATTSPIRDQLTQQ